ncbi:hypothetical protein BB560_005613, partial [Smittium megazygosporum]
MEQNPSNFNAHPEDLVKKTPLPSVRRNRLARELESARKDLPTPSFPHLSQMPPPSTILRNRFREFLNGPTIPSTNQKKRRILDSKANLLPPTPLQQNVSDFTPSSNRISVLNQIDPPTTINESFVSKLKNVYETPVNSKVSEPAQLSNSFFSDSPNPMSSKDLALESSSPSNFNYFVNSESPNSGSLFSTPKNLSKQLSPYSESDTGPVSRPASALKKIFMQIQSDSVSNLSFEQNANNLEKAQYEQKKSQLEQNKLKIEIEKLTLDYSSKLESQAKKIASLEKDLKYQIIKEKEFTDNIDSLKSQLDQSNQKNSEIIKNLEHLLENESKLRADQERISEVSISSLKSKLSTFESRVSKLDKYTNLMNKQLLSILAENDPAIAKSNLDEYDLQMTISCIKSTLSSKNSTIQSLENDVSDLRNTLDTQLSDIPSAEESL